MCVATEPLGTLPQASTTTSISLVIRHVPRPPPEDVPAGPINEHYPETSDLTAAMVVLRRLAASGEVWVTGVVVGWVIDRLVVCVLVVESVVVAVGIGSSGVIK